MYSSVKLSFEIKNSSLSEGISLWLIMSGMYLLGKLAVVSEQWYFIYCDRLNNQQNSEQNNAEMLLTSEKSMEIILSLRVIPSPKFSLFFKVKRHFTSCSYLTWCNKSAEDVQWNASLFGVLKFIEKNVTDSCDSSMKCICATSEVDN